jgi:hypothetical protein
LGQCPAILPNGILNQTIAGVTDILGDDLIGSPVKRAVLGLFFTGVAAPSAKVA